MIKYRSKKILALILSGVLLAGNVPVTSNAAQLSDERTEACTDSETKQLTGSTEEDSAAEESKSQESTIEENTIEEGVSKESKPEESIAAERTDEESKPEGSTADERTDEESKPEGSTADERTDEESKTPESTTEENTVEQNTAGENSTEESTTAEETTEHLTETEETGTEETGGKETETETETETEETQEEVKALLSDRQIAETDNILSKYNTSFEGTDDKGILYWWNHEAGLAANEKLIRTQYEENQKPSSDCGDHYLQVQLEDGKNKAYICDTEIAGMIKPEVTYEFTYYAKLAEGTDSGEVQLQVTSTSKDWSSQKTASIELDKEITLDATQWKQISGTFKLPAHDKHEQVKVEFAGSDGLSYCIDDLRIAKVEDQNTEDDREIAENILSKYNTSFEDTDDKGILYWWNGPSWSPDGISREAYENDKAPTSDCGSYYLEVSPYNGKSEAQVNHEGIGAVIQPEITYEFTYLVKLAEGQESGQVQLEISSGDAANAEIKLDKEVTLDAAKWQKVSGTFKLPANSSHKEVKIKFAGSDGLSFCIDDLRVAAIDKGDVEYGENLVKNPYFAEDDLSMWEKAKGNALISTAVADEAIFDDIVTYGVIEHRDSSQQCFAQDMTGILKSGGSYEYSFYVMLDAEDYKDAPAEQREVSFGPYVTVDGKSTYWGSYSSGVLDNGCVKKIPAGEWVKFEGTFNPKFDGEADALVIRIMEQGTDYGSGDCVKGKYYLTGVTIHEIKKPIKEIEWDIPNLKDTVSSENGIGSDAYTGALLTVSDLADQPLMDLVHKHFNVVTFENEMKMDAMFGYHDNNNSAPGFETITWTRANGTEMKDYKVPTLDYSRADKILDALKTWNEEHPDNFIKVRGHVFVWHSQAPEWFFHEDWDINKPDASAEVMDARQEWYIKTILDHYTSDSSPYKGMFYGWDVVNEAVSDSTGTYRNENERSSWWRVYKSEDFIVNAFRYANHYAPADLELYYNDYNECMGNKVSGIEKLLTEVKSHEKDAELPTRISAMGMQSHHTISSPTVSQLRDAAIRYGKIVGKIQLTELDLKASDDFDGTEATLQNEYTKQAYRYKEIYDVMREVDAMDDIDVNGITVWGVIDGNSWLQDSSDVGGGADGSKKQVPLLFDDDYKAKPSFYAFVNADKLEPYIRSVTVMQAAEENPYSNGKAYEIQGINASFIPVWTDTELKVQVTVPDTTVDTGDEVTLYIDWDKSVSENAEITNIKMTRADSQEQEDGYVAAFTVPRACTTAMNFSMDIVVSDNGKLYAFNDMTMNQGTSSKYYASAITKPYMTIAKVGKDVIKVDGEQESVWEQAKEVPFQIRTGTTQSAASAKLLWDEQYLYVLADVTDAALDKTSSAVHERDSVEVFIDENNHKSDSYEPDDKQYRIDYENEQSFNGPNCDAENVVSATAVTDKGYLIEAAFKWTEITPEIGDTIGIELQINDAEGGKRIGTVSWYDESGQGWSSPGVFGTATLGNLIKTPDTEDPDVKELLNSLISDCETLKKDEYTDESWIPFAKALEEAKAVQSNAEASQEDLQKALDTLKEAKAGLQKRGEPEPVNKDQLKELISKCETLNKDEYTKTSWETFAKALADAKAAAANETATQEDIQKAVVNLSEALEQLKERQDLWAYDIADITYTGSAVKPNVTVYSGKTLLTLGKDYTVSYKNNTNPTASAEVIIKGKGNYTGSISKVFKIVPKNLASPDIAIADLFVRAPKSGKSITPMPVVMRDGKKLNKQQYNVGAIKDKDGKTVGQVTSAGIYTVTVNGVQENGYTGSREIKMTVLSSDQILMSAVKVTGIKNMEYTGSKVEPKFTVKYGSRTLTLNQEYTVLCDSKEVGTATAIIKGIGEKYVGEKIVTFKIIGTALKAKDVTLENAADRVYTGKAIEPAVRVAGAQPNRDYIVSYENNVNVGTAVVTVKGIGRYSGTIRKTFRIAAFDLKKNAGGKFTYNTSAKVPYMKGGSKLTESDLRAVFDGVKLVEGVDYTLSYSANKKLGTATVKIKGKGNFKGTTAPISFTIEKQNLANLTDIAAEDLLMKKAKSYNRVNPVLRDFDGKVLKKGKDYTITGYTKEDGTTSITGTPKTGDIIRVKVEGRNCYTGVSYADFRIIENNRNIAKAKVKVEPQNYTGKEITVSEVDPITGKRQILVTMKVDGVTMTLKEGRDYEIVKTSSVKNMNKGTGKMTIRGIHGFGGTKTVSFKIKAQDLNHVVWYDSLFSKTMSFFHKE